MPTLWDFIERATTGPIVSEEDFTMDVLIPNVRKIVKEFNIQYDPKNPVSSDDSLADRLFEGAIEFVAKTGVYCTSTNRIIHLDRKEIIQAINNLPEGSTLGEGRESRILKTRMPEDKNPPWFHVGAGIVASTEDIALAQVEGYGSIPQACSISAPAFNRIKGMPVIGGSPLEIRAAINSIQTARKALMNCGRPGLPIMNLISSATTSMGTIAGSTPTFGLRQSDGWLITFISEMKVNFETLNRLAFVLLIGGNPGSAIHAILGGYPGGPEGTALVVTAYFLTGILLCKGAYHLTGPFHFRYGCSTTRECMWIYSVVGRSTSRNIKYPAIGLAYAVGEPNTRVYFYEATAVNLCCVVSGFAGVQTTHPAKAIIDDMITPLDALFNVEVAYGATGMKTEKANQLVDQILKKYEKEIENPPRGKRYQECYNLKTGKPLEDYFKLYEDVKEELSKMGISFQ